jgi:hypothetical protein
MQSDIKKILDESWHHIEKKNVVKLPCGHENIEVSDYGDKYLECGTCHKKYLLNFQRKSEPKLYG